MEKTEQACEKAFEILQKFALYWLELMIQETEAMIFSEKEAPIKYQILSKLEHFKSEIEQQNFNLIFAIVKKLMSELQIAL